MQKTVNLPEPKSLIPLAVGVLAGTAFGVRAANNFLKKTIKDRFPDSKYTSAYDFVVASAAVSAKQEDSKNDNTPTDDNGWGMYL